MSDAPGFYPFAWHPGASGQLLSLQAMGMCDIQPRSTAAAFRDAFKKGNLVSKRNLEHSMSTPSSKRRYSWKPNFPSKSHEVKLSANMLLTSPLLYWVFVCLCGCLWGQSGMWIQMSCSNRLNNFKPLCGLWKWIRLKWIRAILILNEWVHMGLI